MKVLSKVFIIKLISFFIILGVLLSLFVLSLYPFLSERYVRDAYFFSVYKRYQYAIEDMEKAIDYAPYDAHYRIVLGRYYHEYYSTLKDNWSKERLLKKMERNYFLTLKYDPINPWVYMYLVGIYSEYSKIYPEKALYYESKIKSAYEKMAEIGFLNPLFQLNYAFYLHQQNRLSEAAEVYQRVINYDQSMGEASINLANIHLEEKRFLDALECLLDFKARFSEFKGLNTMLANTYLLMNRHQDAQDVLLEENTINPRQEKVLQMIVRVSVYLNDWTLATKYFNQLYTLYPNQEPQFFYMYIHALVKAEYYKQAYRLLLNYVVKFPQDEAAESLLKEIREKIVL